MLQYIFKAILITSLIGTVFTLLLMLMKPVTKKIFSSSWHYYMWLLVLITMVLPVRFAMTENMEHAPSAEMVFPMAEQTAPNGIEVSAQVTMQQNKKENRQTENAIGIDTVKTFVNERMDSISFLWFMGMCLFLLAKLIEYMVFLIKLHKYAKIISCSELARFTTRKIITRTSDKISSPLMIGFFRPTLLLPETRMTPEQLNNVLAHEMTHLKRKDILYKWFVCLVKCVHWFNPIIYFIGRQVNIECEISCDSAVVKEMTKEQKTGYINTIIALLAAGTPAPNTLTTAMTGNKKVLKKRFGMIQNCITVSKKSMVLSLVFAVTLLCCAVFTSGAANGKMLNVYDGVVTARICGEKKGFAALLSNEHETGECDMQGAGNLALDAAKDMENPALQAANDEVEEKNTNDTLPTGIAVSRTTVSENAQSAAVNTSAENVEIAAGNTDTNPKMSHSVQIKSACVSEEPVGFEQLVLSNINSAQIQQVLTEQGVTRTQNTLVNLKNHYIVRDYRQENTQVMADENGNISIYLSVNNDNLFAVRFIDCETNEDMGQFRILANNENAYSFIGFEKNKTYNVELLNETQDDWNIEGNYIIY